MSEPTKARMASGGTGRSSASSQSRASKGKPEEPKERKGAERLKRKHDTDSGMTTAQRAAVNKFEEKHRSYKTERVVAIDENGKEWGKSKSGKRRETALSGYVPPNCVMTHNHPTRQTRDMGNSFSHQDLLTGIAHDAKEIRVVAGRITYSLRRPAGGWGVNPYKVAAEWMGHFRNLESEARKYIGDGKGWYDQGRRNGRANLAGLHRINQTLANKYGWEYTRKIEK